VALRTTFCDALHQFAHELRVGFAGWRFRIVVENTLMVLMGVGYCFVRGNYTKQ
jgi:hypothetical protein